MFFGKMNVRRIGMVALTDMEVAIIGWMGVLANGIPQGGELHFIEGRRSNVVTTPRDCGRGGRGMPHFFIPRPQLSE
jgi:hypothetical protein